MAKLSRRQRNLRLMSIEGAAAVAVRHNSSSQLYNYISTGDFLLMIGDTVVVRNVHGLGLGTVQSIFPVSQLNPDKYDYMPVIAKVDMTLDAAITKFLGH